MLEKVASLQQLKRVLRDFPEQIKFCFAYGSGAFRQKSDPSSNMLDLIFVVENPKYWHSENLRRNPNHYAQPMRFLGHETIAKVQETWGAKIYYNTLVTTSEGRNIKYGVISEKSLIEDLLDWNFLYLAGRLHKPVHNLIEPEEKSQLRLALMQNLHSAIHTALLLLPEHFTEINFYKRIASLSYNGDFRMIFGEDKDKVTNIVVPQLTLFKELYSPILQHFDKYMDVPQVDQISMMCRQDLSPITRIHHLNHLPRMVQMKLVRAWLRGKKSKDTEDCLRAIAHDPDCEENLDACLKSIVWKSSVSQSLKGIVTAGIAKAILYSGRKVKKMLIAGGETKTDKLKTIDALVDNVVKKETESKNATK